MLLLRGGGDGARVPWITPATKLARAKMLTVHAATLTSEGRSSAPGLHRVAFALCRSADSRSFE